MDIIKVLVVDDHFEIREGLTVTLPFSGEVDVIGKASNGKEAVYLAEKLKPDVILMDLRMPIMDGIQATKQIKRQLPNIQIVIVSQFDEDSYIHRSIEAGAIGFVIKGSSVQEYLNAIRIAAQGELRLPTQITSKLNYHFSAMQKSKNLSNRELDVLHFLVKGLRNKDIANELGIREHTVKHHVASIISKLEVKSRTEAATQAVKLKLVVIE